MSLFTWAQAHCRCACKWSRCLHKQPCTSTLSPFRERKCTVTCLHTSTNPQPSLSHQPLPSTLLPLDNSSNTDGLRLARETVLNLHLIPQHTIPLAMHYSFYLLPHLLSLTHTDTAKGFFRVLTEHLPSMQLINVLGDWRYNLKLGQHGVEMVACSEDMYQTLVCSQHMHQTLICSEDM